MVCLIYTFVILFMGCSCSPIKPKSPDEGATDECYGTHCYYDVDPDYTETVNVNYPENYTQAVLSSLSIIGASQRETVDLLDGTLVVQESVLFSQNQAVVLQNKTLVLQEKNAAFQDEALKLLNKTVALLESIEGLLTSSLATTDRPTIEPTTLLLESIEGLLTSSVAKTDRPTIKPTNLPNQLITQSTELPPARDCQDIVARGINTSGPYVITPPDGLGSFEVYCDLTDTEGWTVFQKRIDGSVDFHRNWTEYEEGFGDASGEYWLGLKNIRRLISDGTTWALRIDLESFGGDSAYAFYDTFSVNDGASNYTLSIGEYSGNAGDSMKYTETNGKWMHNGMPFSALDRDNDKSSSENCAYEYKGGWWFNNCFAANLNGKYLSSPGPSNWQGVIWYTWKSKKTLKSTQMKIRRVL